MRYPLSGYLLLVVFVLLIDGCLILLRRYSLSNDKPISFRWVAFLFHWVSPIVFILGFLVLYFLIPTSVTPVVYDWFGYGLVAFLCVYLAKLFWLGWQGASSLWERRRLKRSLYSVVDQLSVPYPSLSRRKFLSQVGIVIATVPVMGTVFGTLKGRFDFMTRYRKLSFPNLPAAFDGLRIVHISDSHLGSFQSDFDALDEVVEIVNGHHPDLIVFTGDLVNNFHQETTGWERVFTRLNAPMGRFSILGNHDYGYYSRWTSPKQKEENFAKIVEANERLGFRLLRNENVVLQKEGQSIALAGVEYWGTSGHFPNTGKLDVASRGIEEIPFKILLSHDPDHWMAEVAEKTDYDLMLAGHTHGMQFGFDIGGYSWSPAQYKFKQWDGLYRHGNQFLFVNRGLGTLSMPVRLGMKPEITLIELSRGPVSTEPM